MSGLAVVNLHYVRARGTDGVHPVTPSALESLVDRLAARGRFVDLPAVVSAAWRAPLSSTPATAFNTCR